MFGCAFQPPTNTLLSRRASKGIASELTRAPWHRHELRPRSIRLSWLLWLHSIASQTHIPCVPVHLSGPAPHLRSPSSKYSPSIPTFIQWPHHAKRLLPHCSHLSISTSWLASSPQFSHSHPHTHTRARDCLGTWYALSSMSQRVFESTLKCRFKILLHDLPLISRGFCSCTSLLHTRP